MMKPTSTAKIANSKSWQNIPMKTPKPIEVNLVFTKLQFEMIKRGYIPECMEDKWFMYFEDNWVHLFRSWTGIEVYKAEIRKTSNKYTIKKFFVEIDPTDIVSKDDKSEKELFTCLIYSLISWNNMREKNESKVI